MEGSWRQGLNVLLLPVLLRWLESDVVGLDAKERLWRPREKKRLATTVHISEKTLTLTAILPCPKPCNLIFLALCSN